VVHSYVVRMLCVLRTYVCARVAVHCVVQHSHVEVHTYMCVHMPSVLDTYIRVRVCGCGVATISRILEIIGLFRKRALQKRLYFAKETYNFKEPTNRSHPMCISVCGVAEPFNCTTYVSSWYIGRLHTYVCAHDCLLWGVAETYIHTTFACSSYVVRTTYICVRRRSCALCGAVQSHHTTNIHMYAHTERTTYICMCAHIWLSILWCSTVRRCVGIGLFS